MKNMIENRRGGLGRASHKLPLLDTKALRLSDSKKGFTLIEVIVVLVILGIMAALIVPALTGYIEKANQRAAIAEAGTYRAALQAMGTETVASSGAPPVSGGYLIGGSSPLATTFPGYLKIGTGNTLADELNALVGNNGITNDWPGTSSAAIISSVRYDASGQLIEFLYTKGDYAVNYTVAGGYTIGSSMPTPS
ncbi:MAG: type II secretion system GspH family protein [Coriobacteriales bacterium]|jgi:prepilin-type N-terminal cleavage/methylation domain-containing protein|nr:type II secretion system GspH family protein [Coriobacteriales bacterium]